MTETTTAPTISSMDLVSSRYHLYCDGAQIGTAVSPRRADRLVTSAGTRLTRPYLSAYWLVGASGPAKGHTVSYVQLMDALHEVEGREDVCSYCLRTVDRGAERRCECDPF